MYALNVWLMGEHMNSILKLRADCYSPVLEILNLSARGINEAQTIAGWYAESKNFGYWELQFNKYAPDTPRLVRNKSRIWVDRDLKSETKRGFNDA